MIVNALVKRRYEQFKASVLAMPCFSAEKRAR